MLGRKQSVALFVNRSIAVVLFALTMIVCGPAAAAGPPVFNPPLDEVAKDKGEIAHSHCRALDDVPVVCTFGDRASDTTVALFGDSHALQWGPALIPLAERRDWRLDVIVKTGCPIADVEFEAVCDGWRRNALKVLEAEQPRHVIVGTSIGRRYRLTMNGHPLGRRESGPVLTAGLARTLRRIDSIPSLARDGSGVTVIRDQVTAPFLPVACLREHPRHPKLCRFPRHRRFTPGFDYSAAKRVGIRRIDPLPALCGRKWCYSARDGIVIYRDSDHLTATFARTLDGWLGGKLGF